MSHVERFELAWGRLEDTLIKKCPKPKPIKIEHLNKKGASEKEFLSVLKKRFEDNLLTAHSIEDDERMYQYVPDFVYYDSLMGVCIDIEIDEPYDGLTKKPIHYVGKDDERDNYFLSKNWIVIRFAEEQVITEPQACVDIIAKVLNKYAGFMDDFNDDRNLNTVKVWTREDAEIMSQKLYRNSYLPFEFNYSQNSHKELSIKQQIEKDNTESSDYDLPF